jgi:hypothetical protein
MYNAHVVSWVINKTKASGAAWKAKRLTMRGTYPRLIVEVITIR